MKFFDKFKFEKIKNSLSKTKENIFGKINQILKISPSLTDDIIEQVEEVLLLADIGHDTSKFVIENSKKAFKKGGYTSTSSFLDCVKDELNKILIDIENPSLTEKLKSCPKPYVILICGVNGVGKTTTIGKLANYLKSSGFSVMIGSADTFRAAANEQLVVWANRAKVEIVQQTKSNDPGAVVYETLTKAIEKNIDVVIIDTAGRLHVKKDLMDELNKIQKIIEKKLNKKVDDIYLILDGNIGQNAIIQTNEFLKYVNISGLVVTKLDGTAKGGIIFQICHKNRIPVKFIGLGEGIDDFEIFESETFISAIFD